MQLWTRFKALCPITLSAEQFKPGKNAQQQLEAGLVYVLRAALLLCLCGTWAQYTHGISQLHQTLANTSKPRETVISLPVHDTFLTTEKMLPAEIPGLHTQANISLLRNLQTLQGNLWSSAVVAGPACQAGSSPQPQAFSVSFHGQQDVLEGSQRAPWLHKALCTLQNGPLPLPLHIDSSTPLLRTCPPPSLHNGAFLLHSFFLQTDVPSPWGCEEEAGSGCFPYFLVGDV